MTETLRRRKKATLHTHSSAEEPQMKQKSERPKHFRMEIIRTELTATKRKILTISFVPLFSITATLLRQRKPP